MLNSLSQPGAVAGILNSALPFCNTAHGLRHELSRDNEEAKSLTEAGLTKCQRGKSRGTKCPTFLGLSSPLPIRDSD